MGNEGTSVRTDASVISVVHRLVVTFTGAALATSTYRLTLNG